MQDNEVVAIIRDVGYGCRDVGRPVLWFTTYTSESTAALQVLEGEEANKLIRESGVYNVQDLNGKPCYVMQSDGLIRFLRVWR